MIDLIRKYNEDGKLASRICMLALLLAGFTYAFVAERVPHADGAGWDGVLYRDMCYDFIGMLQDGQISIYYIQKCLPFALVNIINTALSISHPLHTLIALHYIALIMAIVAFFKIANHFKLNLSIEWIAYALTFWQMGLLKFTGYYPYSGDFFAYSFALWIFYFFVTKQPYKMLGLSLVGAFVWQSMLPLSLILFVLPTKGYNIVDGINIMKKDKIVLNLCKALVLFVVAMIPITILLYAKSQGGWWMWSQVIPYSLFSHPKWVLPISSLGMLGIAYMMLRPFNFNIGEFIKCTIVNISWCNVAIATMVYVGFKFGVYYLSNPLLDPPISSKELVLRILWEPYIFPLKFCSTHLAACGLVLPLFIVLYKSILKEISEHSIGYIAAIAMLLLFGLQSETRYVLNFIPFAIFPIAAALNKVELKKWVPYALCVVQFIFSGIWYHINIPELAAVLEEGDSWVYVQSDIAQRFFYYYGPWQGVKAYTIFMSAFVVMMTVLFVGKKCKWFVK